MQPSIDGTNMLVVDGPRATDIDLGMWYFADLNISLSHV